MKKIPIFITIIAIAIYNLFVWKAIEDIETDLSIACVGCLFEDQ